MIEVGSYEAKTHFAQFLERAHGGEKFVVTKNGNPMAELLPLSETDQKSLKDVVRRMRALRTEITADGNILDEGQTWRSLAHEDHQW